MEKTRNDSFLFRIQLLGKSNLTKKYLPIIHKSELKFQTKILYILQPEATELKWKLFSRVRLCDPMDYTVHGILQARILEWVAIPFSKGFSQPRDQTQVSRIAGGFFTSWARGEVQECWSGYSPAALPDPGSELVSPALQADSLPAELPGKPTVFYTWN